MIIREGVLTLKNYSPLQVSILCSHVQQAKQLRDILKQCSVFTYIYTSFDEFWKNSQTELSHLYLVDITMASGDERAMNDHPQYQSKQMNVVFYYNPRSLPLLTTPYKVNSFGYFDIEGPDLSTELSLILDSLQAQENNKREVGKLKVELHQTRQQLHRSVEKVQNYAQECDYQKLLAKIIHQMDCQCQRYDFFSALDKVVGGLDFIHRYALFELTYNGQKLVSPRSMGRKYRTFPSLWLGMDHGILGIQQYAQGLAHQVAVDYMGEEVVSLGLKPRAETPPQLLVYLKGDSALFKHLNWDLLQSLLSGFYGRSLLREWDRSQKSSHFIGPWEFYDLLTDTGGIKENPCCLLILEFQHLVAALTKKSHDDFQWKRFYEEFSTRLDARIKHDYFSTCLGRWGMAFFVSYQYQEQLRVTLEEFSQKFAYWRFFDDPDEILVLNLDPRLITLKALRKDFFKYLAEKNREDANRYAARRLIEEKGPHQVERVLERPTFEA